VEIFILSNRKKFGLRHQTSSYKMEELNLNINQCNITEIVVF